MSIKLSCRSGSFIQENIKNVNLFCKTGDMPLNNLSLRQTSLLMEPEHVFKRLRMIWSQLEDIMEDKLPPNFNTICENNEILEKLQSCVFVCKNFVSDATKESLEIQIKLFRRSINRFSEMENLKLNKLNCNALQKESSGICQYFHTYLQMHWHLIILEYCLFGYNNNTRSHIIQLMNDLTVLSYLKHNRFNSFERDSDPFLCPCVKTVWICLQLLLEKHSNHEFWNVFNEVLKERDSLFSLWLLSHIAKLQGFDETGNYLDSNCKRVTPNLDFVEMKLKSLFNSADSNVKLVHNCLLNIEPLINLWWCKDVKISIFQLMWEYFYKNLNFIPEDAIPTNAIQILTIAQNLRIDPRSAKTAYQLYVGMLSKYLQEHGNQWIKLKGRIYSRLPVKKSASLGNSAFFNVYVLFMCLAPIEFEEITLRICNMLENLLEDQQQNNVFVWNLYCALIILYLQNERSVQTAGKSFINAIQECVKSRDSFYLIKNFISNLEDIMKASSNYTLGQFLFLDSWIKKYLQHANVADVDELLKVLINIVNQVYNSDAWSEWDPVFQIHIFPSLKTLAATSNASPHVGELAAALCKLSPELCNQGMAYFTDDPVDPAVSASFVLTILQNQLVISQENFIIRAWLRCCLLSTDCNLELTKRVLTIHPSFNVLKNKLVMSSNALYDVLELLAKEPNKSIKENVLKLLLDNLTNVDAWVKIYIKEPRGEALTVHIYTCVAVLVYNFAPFLYNKTKSSCLLSRIISTFLLPVETLMGRSPHNCVLHSVQKTWHLFFKGICSLNWNDDVFLERTLRDLVLCYVPHFPTDNNSPLLKCFDDETIATMIIHKTANGFLNQSSKTTKPHSVKVLRFFDNFLAHCSSLAIMKFIAHTTLVVFLEFLLLNLHCNAAVSVLISLTSNDLYDVVREDVHRSITVVTEKHLTFNSNNYFQLIQILIKIIPADIKVILPKIRQSVVSLEKIRGDGYDSTLRKGLRDIETALSV